MVDRAGFEPAYRQFMRLLLYPGLATGPQWRCERDLNPWLYGFANRSVGPDSGITPYIKVIYTGKRNGGIARIGYLDLQATAVFDLTLYILLWWWSSTFKLQFHMAKRVGFEPTEDFTPRLFSRQLP